MLIAWDLVEKRPPAGAYLMPPAEFAEWYKTEYPQAAPMLAEALANVQHHGTSHLLASVTPAKLMAAARVKHADRIGPITGQQLVEMFSAPLGEPLAKVGKPKAKGKPKQKTPPKD